MTLTTLLEAVNVILAVMGEAPASSLTSGLPQADQALGTLYETSKAVQSESWHFNTEEHYTLTPNMAGNLVIPENAIQVDASGRDEMRDITVRGNRVYDRGNQTYVFNTNLMVNMTLVLSWDDLPQAAREYIKIRAARVVQTRRLGSEELDKFSEEDESLSRVALTRFDAGRSSFNMLNDNISVVRVISR